MPKLKWFKFAHGFLSKNLKEEITETRLVSIFFFFFTTPACAFMCYNDALSEQKIEINTKFYNKRIIFILFFIFIYGTASTTKVISLKRY